MNKDKRIRIRSSKMNVAPGIKQREIRSCLLDHMNQDEEVNKDKRIRNKII